MIDREHELPISRQAQVLGISRGSVYYLPRAVAASDLALMRRISVFPFWPLSVDFCPFYVGTASWIDLLRAGAAMTPVHGLALLSNISYQLLYLVGILTLC